MSCISLALLKCMISAFVIKCYQKTHSCLIFPQADCASLLFWVSQKNKTHENDQQFGRLMIILLAASITISFSNLSDFIKLPVKCSNK